MSEDDDPLAKLARSIKEHQRAPKASRANRTIPLSEPGYSVLRRYCKSKGVFVGDVLDKLITAFLEKVKDDLPPET